MSHHVSHRSGKDELVTNLYESVIPSRFKQSAVRYKNYKRMRIDLPARVLVIGGSGSGKSNLVACLINAFGCFNKVLLVARELDEPIWKWLRHLFSKIEKKLGKQILFYTDDLAEVPDVKAFDPAEQTLIIVDDMINDKNLGKSNIPNIWTMGRKYGITSILISQSYYKVPMILRQNSNYIILKKVASLADLGRITREYNLDMDPKQLMHLYRHVVKTIKDFLLIDVNSNEPGMQFRNGFKPILRLPAH
jgi:hypothetical protein